MRGGAARAVAAMSDTRVALIFAALGATLMTVAQAVRAWDGAFFSYTVIHNEAWYAPWSRKADYVWESLPRLTLAVTDDVGTALWAFCAAFALIPLLAILLCWLVASDRPDLFAWGVLGVCLACLPGQWFVVSEAQIAIQLGWPLLLAAAAGLRGRRAVVAVALMPLLLWQHPFAAAVFVGAAALVILAPYLPGARVSPGRFGWAAALLALAALRVTLIQPHEGGYTRATLVETSRGLIENSTGGLVRPALVLIGLAAAAMLLRPRRRMIRLLAPTLIAAAGVLLAIHVSDPSSWGLELDYRAAVLFVTAPLGVLMVLDLRRAERPAMVDRGRVAVAAAAVFAAVLAVQAISWRGEVERLGDAVASGPRCRSVLEVASDGPLVHWATPYNAILEQGRRVDRLVLLTPGFCARFAATGAVHLGSFGSGYDEPPGNYEMPTPATADSFRAAGSGN